ncbi:MAG: NAD(P)H-dependent oxidoreductase subunit E [Deltaproteobacteria bacterium]|jgi:NADH:ubiquinone oxidoreductase subunit E|nr:NAD(P)H-dependent oxidoreductase subunit E [Deltaproteobacteria bacterium]
MNPEHIEKIIEDHRGGNQTGLISILEEIQAKYSFLPKEALRIVAQKMGCSLVDLYGVATFYKAFSLKPRGKHLISVCLGTACHVRRGEKIASEFQRQLRIKPGETTPDNEISLETVNCLGACALGPIVVVDGHYFSNVTFHKVKEIIHQARVGLDRVDIQFDERTFPVEVSCSRCNHSLMDQSKYIDGYPSIRVTVSFNLKHGWLRLSCLYGSFSVEHEYEIPKDAVVNFFCPHCHAELKSSSSCVECGAPMVPLLVRGGGGMVQICSRRGCKGHMLDLTGVNF